MRRLAVLVVDMQNDYCHPDGVFGRFGWDVARVQSVIAEVGRLVDRARAAGVRVVWTKQTQYPGEWGLGEMARAHAWRYVPADRTVQGSWGHELVAPLQAPRDEPVIEKLRRDAFHGTPLEAGLRAAGVGRLICAGVLTEGCVLATCLGALSRDFEVVIPLSAVGSMRPELEAAAVQILKDTFTTVPDVDALPHMETTDAEWPTVSGP